ncbi:MAG TPA: ImcF-related family protein [Bryobacteraceae bacterium]|jgi:type VI secretion system protein ImpL|nr:ImcF-related family protein [Bryobacteraceae bacterium]
MSPTVIISGIVLGAVALIVAAITMYFQKKTQEGIERASQGGQGGQGSAGAPAGGGDADPLIREASARLAQSKAGAGVANLPMIFVIGDRGTAKTSTILNSGLDPELLAGQVYQDNAVAPTRAANIFFARGTVFVEAGGALMANPQSWTALVKKLQPSRLKSMGASGQAPRGVLLCFDLETFTRAGATEAIANATRYLQARLGEISEILGISYPVYVLFTRADRIPFFAEFVRNLNPEEAGQVVGATVPIRAAAAGGVYSEEETQRLTWAFNQLFHSFCDHRLLLLPREGDATKLPQAYEFPREFRKLRNALVQFLVDVCRPSQLRAGPFLRGFYFSGVRPVAAAETPVALVAPTTPAEHAEVGGATRMFRAGFQAEQKARQGVAQAGGGAGRKVPQWLFLGHLFNDVVLADANARAASGSSTRTSLVKRILLVSAAAICLIYSGLLAWSYFGNRALEQESLAASRGIPAAEGAGGAVPGVDSFQKLETVRQSLAKLTAYERDGAPFSLRWGLYKGSDILPDVRKVYYAKFRQLLFGSTQAQMLTSLQRSPATPGPNDDYGPPYDTLKSYLLTTSEWKRSSDAGLQSFLASKLDAKWIGGRDGEIGKERLDLAKKQFDFYASDLHNGNPYSSIADDGAVMRARVYLSQFSGLERVYQGLLGMADKQFPPVSFNQKFPGTATVLASSEPVRGAFTKEGAKVVQDAIRKQNFAGEEWVLGPYKGQMPDKAVMEKGLMDRYSADYIAQWRNVLKKSNVNHYAGLKDASSKLTLLTGSGAPLLALFWWTSQNTCVDVPGVADKFKAPQGVVPCPSAQLYIVDANKPYNSGLQALQQAVDRAADPSANKEDASHAMRDSGQSATLTARQLGASFPPDPDAQIDQRSLELLLQPIKYLDGMVSSDLKGSGQSFCQAFNQATFRKFPFDPQAKDEVKLDDLAALLQPKTGKLWVYYDGSLKSVLQCSNGECSSSGGTPLSPGFAAFIGNLMKFSRAIYGDSGAEMNYQYSLTPQKSDLVDEFDVTINGAPSKLKGGTQHSYVWPGSGARNFELDLKLVGGGLPQQAKTYDGPWSVFRFFADADKTTGNLFSWSVTSGRDQQPTKINGKPLTYDFSVGTNGPAVFSKEFLSKLKCVVPVAR